MKGVRYAERAQAVVDRLRAEGHEPVLTHHPASGFDRLDRYYVALALPDDCRVSIQYHQEFGLGSAPQWSWHGNSHDYDELPTDHGHAMTVLQHAATIVWRDDASNVI